MIKGETVILLKRTESGKDEFNTPIYTEEEITVNNVLVGSPIFDQVLNDLNVYGKRLAFTLGIPKGDENEWEDVNILIRGERYRTYGASLLQTDANVPGLWNRQVKVEKYG